MPKTTQESLPPKAKLNPFAKELVRLIGESFPDSPRLARTSETVPIIRLNKSPAPPATATANNNSYPKSTFKLWVEYTKKSLVVFGQFALHITLTLIVLSLLIMFALGILQTILSGDWCTIADMMRFPLCEL